MPKPVLFVWNEGPFADQLRSAGHEVRSTLAGLNRLRRLRKYQEAPVVVLAELAKQGRLTNFDGLQLVVDLFDPERRTSIPPLVLCSFLSREDLIAHLGEQQRREVLSLRVPYVQLPASIDTMVHRATQESTTEESAVAPSPMLVAWARRKLFNPYELWAHDLRREARSMQGFLKQLKRVEQSIRVRGLDPGPPVALAIQQAWEWVEHHDHEDVEQAARRLADALVAASTVASREDISREPYSILVVEDDEAQLSQVCQGLAPYFHEVEAYTQGHEALNALVRRSEDGRPFDAVVADWDLREGGVTNGLMQPLQGFELLERAVPLCDGPLVALTSLPPEVVTDIFRAAGAEVRQRVSWFPKRNAANVSDQDFGAIASYLKRLIWDLEREELPPQAPWTTHGHGRNYRALRHSSEWDTVRQQIAERARVIYQFYRDGGSGDISSKRTPPLAAPIAPLGFNPKSTSTGPRSTSETRDRLCARLVVLGLAFRPPAGTSQGNLKRIYLLLRGEDPDTTGTRKDSTIRATMAELGLSHAALTLDIVATNLLQHDSEWLHTLGVTDDELEATSALSENIIEAVALLYEDTFEPLLEALRDTPGLPDPDDVLDHPALDVHLGTQSSMAELQRFGDYIVAQFETMTDHVLQSTNNWAQHQVLEAVNDALLGDNSLWMAFPEWERRFQDVQQRLQA
ncbi:MAG: response regulator [Bacteroidota bacterium]